LEIGHMKWMLIVGIAVCLSSCVETVAFRSLPSSYESAQRALASERALVHPQTVAIREREPAFAPISFCAGEGAPIIVDRPQVTRAGICGRALIYSNAASSPLTTERCWSFAEISTIGEPRDATAIGYYAVRGYFRCPN
jgi:hypothetical protein